MFELKKRPPNPIWLWNLYKDRHLEFQELVQSQSGTNYNTLSGKDDEIGASTSLNEGNRLQQSNMQYYETPPSSEDFVDSENSIGFLEERSLAETIPQPPSVSNTPKIQQISSSSSIFLHSKSSLAVPKPPMVLSPQKMFSSPVSVAKSASSLQNTPTNEAIDYSERLKAGISKLRSQHQSPQKVNENNLQDVDINSVFRKLRQGPNISPPSLPEIPKVVQTTESPPKRVQILLSEEEESPKKKLKTSPVDSPLKSPTSKGENPKVEVKTPTKAKPKAKAKPKKKKAEDEVVEDKEVPRSFINLETQPELLPVFSKLLETEPFVFACIYADGSTNYRQAVQTKRKKKNSMMHSHMITGFALFFTQSNKSFFLPFGVELKKLMSSTVPSTCFNCQDLLRGVLKTAKWKLEDIRDIWIVDNCFDPLVASFMMNPDYIKAQKKDAGNEFDSLLNTHVEKSQTTPIGSPLKLLSRDMTQCYLLKEKLKVTLEKNGLNTPLLIQEMPLIRVIILMEAVGIELDRDYLLKFKDPITKRMEELTEEAHKIAGHEFLLSSPQQVGKVLYEEMGFANKSDSLSTSEENLLELGDHPIIHIILEYRKLSKMLSSYIENITSKCKEYKTDKFRVHCLMNLTDVATGRIQSIEPNLQNLPKGEVPIILSATNETFSLNVRKAFISGAGKVLISADYRETELRLMAHACADPKLIEFFRNKQDQDFFKWLGVNYLGKKLEDIDEKERKKIKGLVYACIYGVGAKQLSKNIGVTEKEAQNLMNSFFYRFPKIKEFRENTIAFAKKFGYITTFSKRRRLFPDINNPQFQLRSAAERQAVNSVIQGTGADLIKMSLLLIEKQLREEKLSHLCTVVLSIHDELLFEVDERNADKIAFLIKNAMESVCTLDVPLKVNVKIGKSWGSLQT